MSSFSNENGFGVPTSEDLDATVDRILKDLATNLTTSGYDTSGNEYEWILRHKNIRAMEQAAPCESIPVSLSRRCYLNTY